MNTQDRIKAALLAYAAADAAGVPWEGCPRNGVDWRLIEHLPQRHYCPRGATSDDTEQTLIMAEYLLRFGTAPEPAEFLKMMVEGVTGCGRATYEALEEFKRSGALRAARGSSNGAAMRILPVGWAVPDDATRRLLATSLSGTTHGRRPALVCACIMAAMANESLNDGATIDTVLNAASAELAAHGFWEDQHANIGFAYIVQSLRGEWSPPDEMLTDAVVTIANIIYILRQLKGGEGAVAYAIKQAVALGGDTDTVAALVAGIVGALTGDVSSISWFALMPAAPLLALQIDRIAEGLAEIRRRSERE